MAMDTRSRAAICCRTRSRAAWLGLQSTTATPRQPSSFSATTQERRSASSPPKHFKGVDLGIEDTVEVCGSVLKDERAPGGVEVLASQITVLNAASRNLPFLSNSDASQSRD